MAHTVKNNFLLTQPKNLKTKDCTVTAESVMCFLSFGMALLALKEMKLKDM